MSSIKVAAIVLILLVLASPLFAAKRIIVIQQKISGDQVCYATANWYIISSGQLAQTSGSAWTGASTAENTAIQNGSVLEEVANSCFPVGQDVTTIKALLVNKWTVRNSQLNGVGPGQYQGVFFDSATGWSQ
jgi:hypothetical protein